jgi:tripartite-type tricarboxylate transporter receptor subunit TctC
MQPRILRSISLAIAATATVPAWAAWPDDKPIEVAVGFAAGGGTDLMARKLLPFVQKRLGPNVQFIVQNKPGAAGEIANAYVARAKPDGYTLAIVNVPGFLYLPMTKKAQYEVSDFQLISRVVDDPTIVVTKSDNKVNTFQAVLAALKQNPGSLAFGHNGTGTNGELALQMLGTATGAKVNAVPYKGTAAQKTDVLGGHLEFGLVSVGEVPELHPSAAATPAQIRALVQFSPKRSSALPQVPTAVELGVNVVMSSERGFAAPKGVPAEIIRKLDQAIAESIKDPAFIANASSDAPVLAYLPGDQWTASLQQNRKLLEPLAKAAPKE